MRRALHLAPSTPRSRSLVSIAAVLAIAALVGGARDARAEGSSPPPAPHGPPTTPAPGAALKPLGDSLKGQAKAAYDAARLLAGNLDYPGALVKFSQAYDASKDARLLYDMAVCERNLHHYARMKVLLERYINDPAAASTPETLEAVRDALHATLDLVGMIKVNTQEPGATVEVDGEVVGTTPLWGPVTVDLGQHTLSVHKEGFAPFDKLVQVVGGNEVAVDAQLARQNLGPLLIVTADPAATIFVDGAGSVGGKFESHIAAGPHDVRVTQAGRVPRDTHIELRNGETRQIDVSLEAEKPRGMPIWPWIVGGAVVAVAGASVGGYFLFRPSGSTAPPAGQLGTVNFASVGRVRR